MKKINYHTALAALLLCVALGANAKPLDCTLDFARFRADESKIQLDLHYSFPDTAMSYAIQNDGTYLGSLYCKVELLSALSSKPTTKEWIIDNASNTEVMQHIRNLVGVKSFVVDPGDYIVHIYIRDLNDSTTNAERSFKVTLNKISRNRLVVSDLLIASSITPISELKDNNSQQFVRNSYFIVPNPQKEVIGSDPQLWLYSELYNVQQFLHDSLTVVYRIYDGAHRQVQTTLFRRAIQSDIHIESVHIPVDTLPSGLYYITMTIGEIAAVDTAFAQSKFYVLNPNRPPKLKTIYSEDELFLSSEFATLSDDRIEDEFQKAKYIATKQEIELYASLTETLAKQKFMFKFWRGRDPLPETYINEKLEEYRDLIRYADKNYSNMAVKQGWKTDRGRILLKYGKPTQIDKYYTIADTRPYEIWFYSHLQGGIQFSYVDKSGIGNFILVHSTAMGEMRNDDWINLYVKTAGSGSGVDLPSTPK